MSNRISNISVPLQSKIINQEMREIAKEQKFCPCLLPNNVVIVLQSWSKLKRYRFILQNIAKIIGYAYTTEFFTNENIQFLLSCKNNTAREYISRLKELDLIKETRELNASRKYTLKKYSYIHSLYMLLLNDLVCPKMLDQQSVIKENSHRKHKAIKEHITACSGKNV